jgi:predicted nuclease of predicted toxin-antitoxin system
MAEFLIDANLPYFFSLWNNNRFIHLKDINDVWTDSEVWEYALKNHLTIITKDSDFSNRILFKEPPPKVIHIKFGNIRINEFHNIISNLWNDIEEFNKEHKLVNVYTDRIEGIS